MPFYKIGSIKYFKFPSLDIPGIYHAVISRHGGFSPQPWKSLNFGGSVGDDPARVIQNRVKALTALDINPLNIYDVYQVHSNEIVITSGALSRNEAHVKADAILTSRPKLTLLMRFADCVPILLYDPVKHVIGVAHAGWKGTVNKIAAATVKKMSQQYGTQPEDILAAIGPSIGPDHYSVGSDVIELVKKQFTRFYDQLISNSDGKAFFDLWNANLAVLNEAGVKKVEIAGICTNCDLDDWYSHRGEHGRTGRFGVLIGLY